MNTASDKLPALRPVQIVPLRNSDGQTLFALHDPTRLAPRAVAVSPAAYFVLAHLDGQHSCQDIQAALQANLGAQVSEDDIHRLVNTLDEALFLQGPRLQAALEERRAGYLAAPSRDCRERYPDAVALRRTIEQLLAGGVTAPVPDVRGLIAPHLDYERGAPCYADAYATLAAAGKADRYVILGTNHFGQSASAVATTKDFQTPLGLVPVDQDFLTRLAALLGTDLCEHQADHFAEHSIELQVLILQVVMDGRAFEIVPILCPDACGPTGLHPADGRGPDLGTFADALAELLKTTDRPTVVIAGADLSHVGQHFGDSAPTTAAVLEQVADSDRRLLRLLEERREDEFIRQIAASRNHTRICSTGAIYATLRCLPGRPCRVLSYHQAVQMEAETHVTCAAAVLS